jgi:hypothetical protein
MEEDHARKTGQRQGNYDLFMKLRKWNDDGSLAYDDHNHHENTPYATRDHVIKFDKQGMKSDHPISIGTIQFPITDGNSLCSTSECPRDKTTDVSTAMTSDKESANENVSDYPVEEPDYDELWSDEDSDLTTNLVQESVPVFLSKKQVLVKPRNTDELLQARYKHSHAGFQFLRSYHGLPPARKGENPTCEACAMTNIKRGNKTRKSHKRAEHKLERLYIDYGIMPVYSRFKHYAFLLIVDDHTRKMWVIIVKNRGTGVDLFIQWHRKILSTNSPMCTKFIHADNEFDQQKIHNHCNEFDINLEICLPYSQFQNGPAEIRMYHLCRRLKACLLRSGLPAADWIYALDMVVSNMNDENCSKLGTNISPNMSFYGQDIRSTIYGNELHEFGILCYARKYIGGKMDKKAALCVYLGRAEDFRAYKVRDVSTRTVYFSRDVKFMPDKFNLNKSDYGDMEKADIINFPLPKTSNILLEKESEIDKNTHTEQHDPQEEAMDHSDLNIKENQPISAPTTAQNLEPIVIRTKGHMGGLLKIPKSPSSINHDLETLREAAKDPPETQLQIGTNDFDQEITSNESDSHHKASARPPPNTDNKGIHDNRNDVIISTAEDEWKPRRNIRNRFMSSKAMENLVTNNLVTKDIYYDFDNGQEARKIYLAKTEEDKNDIQWPSRYNKLPDPTTDSEAFKGADAEWWRLADGNELTSLLNANTWTLVPRRQGMKIRGSRFVRKKKKDPNNHDTVLKYKSRLVCQGYDLTPGVEYINAFAPVVRGDSTKAIMQIAVNKGLAAVKYDLDVYYLSGKMEPQDPPIYMRQTRGWEVQGREDWVCKLNSSLYGLPHAHHLSQKVLNEAMTASGLVALQSDPMVFIKRKGKSLLICQWHVDDSLCWHNDSEMLKECETIWSKYFTLKKTKDIKDYLGIQMEIKNGEISLFQESNIKELHEIMGLQDCKPNKLPARAGRPVAQDMDGIEPQERQFNPLYAKAVGLLIWITLTRYDIKYVVNKLASRMAASNDDDFAQLKFLARYLKGTIKRKLIFRKQKNNDVYAMCDASFADCSNGCSTGGFAVFMGDPEEINISGAIACESFKQKIVAHSTFESEWYSVNELVKYLEWLGGLMNELGFPLPTIIVFCDNEQVLTCGEQAKLHARTKHWRLRMYYVQSKALNRTIALTHIPTNDNTSDLCTKPLPFPAHDKHARRIMGEKHYQTNKDNETQDQNLSRNQSNHTKGQGGTQQSFNQNP